jgi:hypothetical protein
VIALAHRDVSLSELPGTLVGFERANLQDMLDLSTAFGAVNHMRFALYLVCKGGNLSGHELLSFWIPLSQFAYDPALFVSCSNLI